MLGARDVMILSYFLTLIVLFFDFIHFFSFNIVEYRYVCMQRHQEKFLVCIFVSHGE